MGDLFGVGHDTFGVLVDEFSEIFDENVVLVEEPVHGIGPSDGQIALKNDTIKTIDPTLDFVLELLYKIVHGVSAFGGYLLDEETNIPYRKRNAILLQKMRFWVAGNARLR
ncbi:MAG: hypothetical protein FWD31_15055, partial [Planctomycetaceae bacterium]|nr:hypothetical protein [Planctomycetaceae bacterium]